MPALVNPANTILAEVIRKNKAPALHYVIFSKDSVIHSFYDGLADVKAQKKIIDSTSFHAYSVTKTFTALSVLQLAAQNKLDINQPVAGFLPGFPYPSDITVKHLLAHTSGIPNPVPLRWIHHAADHDSFDRDAFFKEVARRHVKVKSPPGEKFAYSNLGYVFLGQLIEKVSGLKYEDYVRQHIIQPLGLLPGDLDFTVNDASRHAKGYQKKNSLMYFLLGFFLDKKEYMDKPEGNWVPFRLNYVNGSSYGGLTGTPMAFAAYIMQLLDPGSKIISGEYKKILFTENRLNNNKATGMCLSWFTGRLNGQPYYTHAGGGGGYYCELRIYPGAGMGSVIMFNRTGMTDERFLDNVDKFFIPFS